MTTVKSVDIADDVMAVIESSRISDDGKVLTLPPGQLERKLYERVAKTFGAIGGKWNRSKGGFVFPKDVRSEVEAAKKNGSVVDEKKTFQAFYTPLDLCDKMVRLAGIRKGDRVLEPSAGDGRLALAAEKAGGEVSCCEIRDEERARLRDRFSVIGDDFLKLDSLEAEPFDAILMNPPFTKQQDVDHVAYAIRFLRRVPRGDADGGTLIAIMGAGFVTSKTKKAQDLRNMLAEFSTVRFHDLPEGTFKESGTNVRAVMLEVW